MIINLKLFVNKICKNSSNLTHYLTTKNFCNLLKFETKTTFSNCQKVVRILHPILLWQITSLPGYLFYKSNFSTASYFPYFLVRARPCCVCPRRLSCSSRTWWAASTPCTLSARGWRSPPSCAMWSRSGCSGQMPLSWPWRRWLRGVDHVSGVWEPFCRESIGVNCCQTRTLMSSTRTALLRGEKSDPAIILLSTEANQK